MAFDKSKITKTTVTVTEVEVETTINPLDTIPTQAMVVHARTKSGVTFNLDSILDDSLQKQPEPTLPPKDTGRSAIIALICVLMLDASLYGFLLAYGIFQEYYTANYINHGLASWIVVLGEGISFLGAPLITWIIQVYRPSAKFWVCVGFALCITSMFATAFLTSIPVIIFTQGVVYGTGVLLVAIPELIILNTWFDKRRGMAYGIVYAGTDMFGVCYTFLATELLHRYGFRITMLVFTALTFIFAGIPLIFLHERIEPAPNAAAAIVTSEPEHSPIQPIPTPSRRRSSALSIIIPQTPRRHTAPVEVPFSPSIHLRKSWPAEPPTKRFYQRSIFYIFTLVNILQGLAWCLPFVYLPSMVTALGHSRHQGATALAVGTFAMIIGDLGFGKLSDKVHVNTLIIASTAVSAAATFILWGFVGSGTNNLAAINAFIFLYGVFGGGYLPLWARMGTLFGERDSQMVYSTLCFGRGVAQILSGPVSQLIIETPMPRALQTLGKGQYGGIIMFVGMCMAGAALMGVSAIVALWWKKGKTSSTVMEEGNGDGEKKWEAVMYTGQGGEKEAST